MMSNEHKSCPRGTIMLFPDYNLDDKDVSEKVKRIARCLVLSVKKDETYVTRTPEEFKKSLREEWAVMPAVETPKKTAPLSKHPTKGDALRQQKKDNVKQASVLETNRWLTPEDAAEVALKVKNEQK